MSDRKLLELRIELGRERLRDIAKDCGESNQRVESYQKRLNKLIRQLNQKSTSKIMADSKRMTGRERDRQLYGL